MLNWLQQFNTFCFLDNHQYHIQPHTEECVAAVGVKNKFDAGLSPDPLNDLQNFIEGSKAKWLFGHLNYDFKNVLTKSISSHPDHIRFPDAFFFEPSILIRISEKEIIIGAEDPELIFSQINSTDIISKGLEKVQVNSRIGKEEYLSIIRRLQQHILRGDCYEINFCQEFFAENVQINPVETYLRLSDVSPNPFSALYRLDDKWLICASPERFLKKQGKQILSQPIKGTSQRRKENSVKDIKAKEELYNSAKDRSENVMIVDLMRNDLSKICEEGSVQVDELYGIYSFPQVHQMISTISGQLKNDISFADILRATFPMGSMTGAPKKKVIELIELYEKTKRGIFSGAVGYIKPSGDFDFNVVIRSIMYNQLDNYLSFQTGSGITFYSDPEKEWEECLLKASAIKEIFHTK
ncbi:anthranilate synthase component I family protein [Terrimonas pollutisoli]|uniref:anthranilate synthase component I family protein n=1 Tax=Terrimonas pollutisoli TaxID=3034147 RepID=UPI0023ECC8F8|nr:anthranilate synthase component I family protein [Terrimonas sp. H1YJ31]